MIIRYTVEENTFVVIFYRLSVQQKYLRFMLMITLKLIVNKRLRYMKKVNLLNLQTMKKNKITAYDLCGF